MNISRTEKSIFSNSCSFKQFSVAMVHTTYLRQLKIGYKKSPEKFEAIQGMRFYCLDKDCYPKICHKNLLKKFLEKIKNENSTIN